MQIREGVRQGHTSAMSEVTAGGQMCEETGSEPVDQGQGRGIGYPLQRESSLARPQESAGEPRLKGGDR